MAPRQAPCAAGPPLTRSAQMRPQQCRQLMRAIKDMAWGHPDLGQNSINARGRPLMDGEAQRKSQGCSNQVTVPKVPGLAINWNRSGAADGMSALGQKQTFCGANAMSALPPKADMKAHLRLVSAHPVISARAASFSNSWPCLRLERGDKTWPLPKR